jgi:hypothetical protein
LWVFSESFARWNWPICFAAEILPHNDPRTLKLSQIFGDDFSKRAKPKLHRVWRKDDRQNLRIDEASIGHLDSLDSHETNFVYLRKLHSAALFSGSGPDRVAGTSPCYPSEAWSVGPTEGSEQGADTQRRSELRGGVANRQWATRAALTAVDYVKADQLVRGMEGPNTQFYEPLADLHHAAR